MFLGFYSKKSYHIVNLTGTYSKIQNIGLGEKKFGKNLCFQGLDLKYSVIFSLINSGHIRIDIKNKSHLRCREEQSW